MGVTPRLVPISDEIERIKAFMTRDDTPEHLAILVSDLDDHAKLVLYLARAVHEGFFCEPRV